MIMAAKNKAVFGIYSSVDQAEHAVNVLIDEAFSTQDVSVLMPDQSSTREFAHRKDTKAPEGATAGATAGGVVGGTLGVLVGLGALAIPGLGPLLAAGPIVAGLAGLGAGGAVGGFIGALVGMGIPEYEARRYEGRVKDGGVLLSVHCETPGEILRAREILTGTGATDIASSTESSAAEPPPVPKARERQADRPVGTPGGQS
jgi:heat induced stress protein YflT